MVSLPSETPLEKTNFSFSNGYQLEIVSWLVIRGMCPLPLSAPGHHLIQTHEGPVYATSLWSLYVRQPCDV